MSAARVPMLALSILAFTTSRRSIALSMPVAEYDSGSFGASTSAATLTVPNPPPAAIAPGPAGLTSFFGVAFFAAPAFGAAFTLAGALVSSSASSRAFSALRASSARRFSSLSSCFLLAFDPWAHLSASLRSCVGICQVRSRRERGRLRTFSASAALAFLASFSAFLALPDSFFAFPPLGAMIVLLLGKTAQREDGGMSKGEVDVSVPPRGEVADQVMTYYLI